jgi:hypothetical protein
MVALKGANANFPEELSLKDFRRLFEVSRFGNCANQKICEEFKTTNAKFAHQ